MCGGAAERCDSQRQVVSAAASPTASAKAANPAATIGRNAPRNPATSQGAATAPMLQQKFNQSSGRVLSPPETEAIARFEAATMMPRPQPYSATATRAAGHESAMQPATPAATAASPMATARR